MVVLTNKRVQHGIALPTPAYKGPKDVKELWAYQPRAEDGFRQRSRVYINNLGRNNGWHKQSENVQEVVKQARKEVALADKEGAPKKRRHPSLRIQVRMRVCHTARVS